MRAAGADKYLLKSDPFDTLIRTIYCLAIRR
jgi:DNA-binding NarL/FixJ family response regulator